MNRTDKFLPNSSTHCTDINHTFIGLTDVPVTYSGSEDRYLKVTTSGVEFSELTTISGHAELSGLGNDDHTQYVLVDGSRGFTSTVSGVAPTEDYHLTNRDYVISIFDGSIDPPGASGISNFSLIQFQYNEDLGVSSTNSASFQEKLSLTVSGIPEGNFRIGWTFDWRISKTNEVFYARIQMDDTEDLFNHTGIPYVDPNYWHTQSSFYYYNNLSSGVHNIDVDYSSSGVGATADIRNTRLEFWRIQ